MKVISLSLSSTHSFSKQTTDQITLIEGIGVEGDAHAGKTVKHRSRVARDPSQPNLRQVHLVHSELLDELRDKGFHISPGQIGENILTQGIDLLSLPQDTRLQIGPNAIVRVTGLRNPCKQLNDNTPDLMDAVLDQDEEGNLIRKSGIMGVVEKGGNITVDDPIVVELPPEPHQALDRV